MRPSRLLRPVLLTVLLSAAIALVIPHNFLNEINMTRENRP